MDNNNDKVSVNPDKGCDIILKGGITSGIVYPKAIFELAKSYRFRSIGGTSAGAIASGLTAAAEYRRNNGSVDGFERLKRLPEDLGEKVNKETRLLSLFAPNDKTKKYYNTLLPFLYEKGKCRKYIYGFFAVLRSYPIITFLYLLIFGVIEYFMSLSNGFWLVFASSLLSLLSALIFSTITNAILFLYKMNRDIKGNNFGLTKGFFSDKEKVKNKAVPLTEWLADLIDDTADKKKEEPLTFGDLQSFDKDRNINLKMVTTNLSYGIPNTLPLKNKFEKSPPMYYFDEEEFREYFPKRVVDWMISNSEEKFDEKFSLPDADKLPVIVGVRMSLSFPVLISAVPLYVMDFKEKKLTKCLYSDGGICSNFPVHFFDSPLPTRPTFAINLKEMEEASADEKKNTSMPMDNGEGLEYEWNKNDGSLMSFIGSITKTMQNWNDNTQLRVPGFRDRICNILLTKDEGGLNLNMESDFIKRISIRGKYAAEELTKRFYDNNTEMNWDNHKWIRLRTTLPLLQKYLKDIQKVYDEYPYEAEMDYKELIGNGVETRSYKLDSNKQREFIDEELEKIFAIVREWDMEEKSVTFAGRKVPRPQPELRIKPSI